MAVVAPGSDNTVIESLPASGRVSGQKRVLRQQPTTQPSSASAAVALAQIQINRSRSEGDLLLFVQVARMSQQRQALKEVSQLKKEMGIFDERIGALL